MKIVLSSVDPDYWYLKPKIDKRTMSFQNLNPNDLFELKRSWTPMERRSLMASPWLGDTETVEMRKRMDFPWQFDGQTPDELQPIMAAEKRDWLKRSMLNF